MSEINFIDYDKITNRSDAFVASDELNCYFQYIPSTKALSYNIKKEKHTAGTTDDPDDYKVPDVKDKLSPKKLYRINPFHKNYAEYLELHKTNVDPEILFPVVTKEVKEVETDYSGMGLNDDQIEFLIALKNLKNLKVEDVSKKLDIDQFEITDEKLLQGFFQVYPRFMEQLVSSNNSYSGISYEEDVDQETFSSDNSDQSMLDYHLKQMGLSSKDLKVKKNFQVRTGNAKDKQITPFLQEQKNDTKIKESKNLDNVSSINLISANKYEQNFRKSITNYNSQTNQQNFLQVVNNTKNITSYQNIRIRKQAIQEQVDFKDIFLKVIKDLNLKNDVTNLYNREINLHSRNITFEHLSQINQSFAKEYLTNIRNQTSVYNFYRSIENRYKEFIQNLNFMNEIYQEFKTTEFKIRNSYQNIHQHNFLQKNLVNKNIINLTKEINFENNLIDYKFQNAILKTVNKNNTFIENNIEKIKDNIKFINNNFEYVNQRVSLSNYKIENKINREVKNVLNNTEVSNQYAVAAINKISNISNNTEIKKLINVLENNRIIESLDFIVRQGNFNTSNVNQISSLINLSNQTNINSFKLSTESLSNIKNFLSLTQVIDKNYNLTEFTKLNKNVEILSFINNLKTSNISSLNQISKTIQEISQISINDRKIENFVKLSKIENVKLLDNINLYTDVQTTKAIRQIRKIKNIQNISQLSENISLIDQSKNDNNIIKISNNSQVNKFIEILQNTKIDARQFKQLKTLEEKSLTKIFEVVNSISVNNIDRISSLNKEFSETKNIKQVENIFNTIKSINQNNLSSFNNIINKTSIIKEVSELSNINLTANNITNVVKLEKQLRSYSEKVKIKETLKTLDLVGSVSKNVNLTNISNSYNEVKKVSEIFENINIIKNQKSLNYINKYSFDSNRNNITNLYNELNLSSIQKSEKITEKKFNSISKHFDKLYKINERVERKASKTEQSFYDLINFTDYSINSKTSTKKEIKNFFQTLNLVKVNNEQIKEKIKSPQKIDTVRITHYNEKIKIDVHKQRTQNYYKVNNVSNFEKKSYFEEKQEKQEQEKVIETKVEELLVKKIQNVTNNITNNVITKKEINNIKQEIIREIFKIEEKYDQKILAIKQETKQTVQNMLSQFLKS